MGPGNTLQNVVVYVSAGAPYESAAPKGCQYLPHVIPMQVIISGESDRDVPSVFTAAAVARLCERRDGVLFVKYPGLNASMALGSSVPKYSISVGDLLWPTQFRRVRRWKRPSYL